jgi:ribonuclease Z
MMFDCGEGTQRQMMRYGTGFSFADIFFTHLHADHFLGVIGLLRTLGLQAREEPMDLWTRAAPSHPQAGGGAGRGARPLRGAHQRVDAGEQVAQGTATTWSPSACSTAGEGVRLGGGGARAPGALQRREGAGAGHPRGPALGEAAPRPSRRGRGTHGHPRGGGRRAAAGAQGGDLRRHPPLPGHPRDRRGRRPAGARGHLRHDEAERAVAHRPLHRPRGRRARRVRGRAPLVLTHFSPRYADDPRWLEKEARAVFPETVAAHDGMVVEVPFRAE